MDTYVYILIYIYICTYILLLSCVIYPPATFLPFILRLELMPNIGKPVQSYDCL